MKKLIDYALGIVTLAAVIFAIALIAPMVFDILGFLIVVAIYACIIYAAVSFGCGMMAAWFSTDANNEKVYAY